MHRVQRFGQIAGSAVKQMFASSRAPEGVAIEAMARLRTQFDIALKTILLKNPSLHKAPLLLLHHGSLPDTRNPPNRVFSDSKFMVRGARAE
jgi:hypothetical protein